MMDIVIIGAGVTGSAVARELSRYDAKICVLEKGDDVCTGTSKANSAIVHAGFDAKANTAKAKFNVAGSKMMEKICKDLDISYRKNGALVVATDESDLCKLEELYENGVKNEVDGLSILTGEEAKELEPNLTDNVKGALLAETSAIICPFELNIALAENANINGVEFKFNTEVINIKKMDDGFFVETSKGVIKTKYVINCAGVYADVFHNMVSERKINIIPRRGDYFLLDKSSGGHVDRSIFPLPTKLGKGILVLPTIHGNLLIGPTSIELNEKEAVNTIKADLDNALMKASTAVGNLPMRSVITSFAGLRAHEENNDFIIGEVEDAKGFIDCAGIESPGLSSCVAIGDYVAKMMKDKMNLVEKEDFIGTRKGIVNLNSLTKAEKNTLIETNPMYGNIVCRCELVSEGQIVDAIKRPLGARDVDGIKRRVRAGMGRCQAGFCLPKTMEILARELNVDIGEITKNGGDSKILVGLNKDSL